MSAGAAAAVRPDPWAGFKAEGSGAGGDAPAEYLGKTLDFFINNWHSGATLTRTFGNSLLVQHGLVGCQCCSISYDTSRWHKASCWQGRL